MAYFEGTIREFTTYLGSYCRIKVMYITKKYRKNLGRCEECGSATRQLEAAHVKGKERPLIISNILSQYIENDLIKVDLDEFQEKFVDAHFPIEDFIRILCSECHRAYDKINPIHEYIPTSENLKEEADLEKLEIKEIKTIEKLLMETIKKSQALDIINSKAGSNLTGGDTLFSNINSAVDVWWLEPLNDKFKTGFHFILNYPDSRSLFHFYVPPQKISNPKELFYQRNDSDYSKIYIPKSGTKFVDKKGVDFGKFLVETIKY